MPAAQRILVVDDVAANVEVLRARLEHLGYEVFTAVNGIEALEGARTHRPHLILLDIVMPKLDGISALKELRADTTIEFIPVILLTAKAETTDIARGLDAGADDYLVKPIDHSELAARVRSMLRIKSLHDTVAAQAAKLQEQVGELSGWNQLLEQRVTEQLGQIERVDRLRRFLAPQVVDLIASSDGEERLLQSHRREVTVVFCDLRGFTAFADSTEPEELMTVLGEYHATLGEIVFQHEGTLERFAGDGIMILFNDPLQCADHTERAVRMALKLREAADTMTTRWRSRGHDLGFGVGIARGYATLGQIGYDRRREYAAIGNVTNLASRLCDEAKRSQILISQRAFGAIEGLVESNCVGGLTLKGFGRPMVTYEILRWAEAGAPGGTSAAQPVTAAPARDAAK